MISISYDSAIKFTPLCDYFITIISIICDLTIKFTPLCNNFITDKYPFYDSKRKGGK